MRDITSMCHVGSVKDSELGQLLSQRVNRAQHSSDARHIYLPSAESPLLTVSFANSGRIARIESDLPAEKLQQLIAEIEGKLLAQTKRQVSSHYLFSALPTVGQATFGDFRISEAPPEAPRPPNPSGHHPLLLEVQFDATPDGSFNLERAGRLAHEYELLLSLFLPSLRHHPLGIGSLWALLSAPVISAEDGIQYPVAEWVQPGYTFPGFGRFTNEFDRAVTSSIKSVADTEYYALKDNDHPVTFLLPASLPEWITKYRGIEPASQRRLLRSAYWLRHAGAVQGLSRSAAILAISQAVECLVPSEPGRPCPCCGLNTGAGPTAKFSSFLNKYAPNLAFAEVEARSKLYSLRSRLTHGHTLAISDEQLTFGWSNPLSTRQDSTIWFASRVARTAAINWFQDL